MVLLPSSQQSHGDSQFSRPRTVMFTRLWNTRWIQVLRRGKPRKIKADDWLLNVLLELWTKKIHLNVLMCTVFLLNWVCLASLALTVLVQVWHQILMRLLFLAPGSPVATPLMTDLSSFFTGKEKVSHESFENWPEPHQMSLYCSGTLRILIQ